jgi:hypothetical protein
MWVLSRFIFNFFSFFFFLFVLTIKKSGGCAAREGACRKKEKRTAAGLEPRPLGEEDFLEISPRTTVDDVAADQRGIAE